MNGTGRQVPLWKLVWLAALVWIAVAMVYAGVVADERGRELAAVSWWIGNALTAGLIALGFERLTK